VHYPVSHDPNSAPVREDLTAERWEELMNSQPTVGPGGYCSPRHRVPFNFINSVSDLVSNTWYRIPFDQSALSISKFPPND